jgi:hypothetical protein
VYATLESLKPLVTSKSKQYYNNYYNYCNLIFFKLIYLNGFTNIYNRI